MNIKLFFSVIIILIFSIYCSGHPDFFEKVPSPNAFFDNKVYNNLKGVEVVFFNLPEEIYNISKFILIINRYNVLAVNAPSQKISYLSGKASIPIDFFNKRNKGVAIFESTDGEYYKCNIDNLFYLDSSDNYIYIVFCQGNGPENDLLIITQPYFID
jgi:hypothetical protein